MRLINPTTDQKKILDIDDETKLRLFFEKRISEEVAIDLLGPEFKGYVVKISGGCDKEGFPMKQGVLTPQRVRLLLPRGTVGFQAWRGKNGEKRRKSVRGCVVGPQLSVLHLVVIKKGEAEVPGLTDKTPSVTLGPKRASRIRKLLKLSKEDDVRKYVLKHKKKFGKREYMRGPTIQRLITPERLARKKLLREVRQERRTKRITAKKEYEAVFAKYMSSKKVAAQ